MVVGDVKTGTRILKNIMTGLSAKELLRESAGGEQGARKFSNTYGVMFAERAAGAWNWITHWI